MYSILLNPLPSPTPPWYFFSFQFFGVSCVFYLFMHYALTLCIRKFFVSRFWLYFVVFDFYVFLYLESWNIYLFENNEWYQFLNDYFFYSDIKKRHMFVSKNLFLSVQCSFYVSRWYEIQQTPQKTFSSYIWFSNWKKKLVWIRTTKNNTQNN